MIQQYINDNNLSPNLHVKIKSSISNGEIGLEIINGKLTRTMCCARYVLWRENNKSNVLELLLKIGHADKEGYKFFDDGVLSEKIKYKKNSKTIRDAIVKMINNCFPHLKKIDINISKTLYETTAWGTHPEFKDTFYKITYIFIEMLNNVQTVFICKSNHDTTIYEWFTIEEYLKKVLFKKDKDVLQKFLDANNM